VVGVLLASRTVRLLALTDTSHRFSRLQSLPVIISLAAVCSWADRQVYSLFKGGLLPLHNHFLGFLKVVLPTWSHRGTVFVDFQLVLNTAFSWAHDRVGVLAKIIFDVVDVALGMNDEVFTITALTTENHARRVLQDLEARAAIEGGINRFDRGFAHRASQIVSTLLH